MKPIIHRGVPKLICSEIKQSLKIHVKDKHR